MPRVEQLARFSQIGQVLIRHGFGYIFDVRRGRREKRGAEEYLTPNFGVRLRRTLDDLGPTFVKFGQLLSTRSDLLPEGVLKELQKLQDTATPVPFETVRVVIENELQHPIEEVYAFFDPDPLGSASIGQVHRATLFTGEDVAVKVQRPEAAGRVESDLELMNQLSSLLKRRFGQHLVIDVERLVGEFEDVIRRELNYRTEAKNAERFAANFAGTQVKIPKVYRDFSARRVLTLEFIEGNKFYSINPLLLEPAERHRIASMGAETIFKMAFEDGFFHGDPHPANLILTPEGRLALLDFGMVGYMSRGDMEALSQLFISVIQRDAAAVVRGLERLGVAYSSDVREELVQEVREFLYKYSGLSVGEVTLGDALGEIISVARRYRLSVPPVYPILAKALITAEGLARSIDPSLNVYEIARPFARRLLFAQYRPDAIREQIQERTLEYSRYLEDYPEQTRQLLAELEKGGLEVKFNHAGLDEVSGEIDILANRLVFAIITGALLVGSSLLGAFSRGGPQVPYLGVPVVSFAGFLLAVFMGSLLVVIISRSQRL